MATLARGLGHGYPRGSYLHYAARADPVTGTMARYAPCQGVGLDSRPMKFRQIMKILEEDGWHLDRQVRSHRQYRHPVKPGTVTIAVHDLGGEVKKGTLSSIMKQAGLKESR